MAKQKQLIDQDLLNFGYWLLPLLLWLAQFIFTSNSFNQIRYEELAESIRNVFWLEQGAIYDGVSSNLGWYLPLLIIYRLFGFSLFAAKYFRLVLSLLSLLSLAALLKKYLGLKKAWLPLIAIGLSPTLLFFTSLQAQFGIDLQYLSIVLFLISILNLDKKRLTIIIQISLGFIIMLALMSYPAFMVYIPALVYFFYYQLKTQTAKISWPNILPNFGLVVLGLLLPLIIGVSWVHDKKLLLHDPQTGGGLFRGAGQLNLAFGQIWGNLYGLILDLISRGQSYYFEVAAGDFSHLLPLVTLGLIIYVSIILIKNKNETRWVIYAALSVLVLSLLISSLSRDPSNLPGIRRNTGVLAAIYALFALTWGWVSRQKWQESWQKWTMLGICLLLPLHHLIVYPLNLEQLKKLSPFRTGLWFGVYQDPQKSIDYWLAKTQQEPLKLSCKNEQGQDVYCRYPEIYSTIAGACLWNQLDCQEILGFDDKSQKFIPLSTRLWENYYWPH